MMKKTSRVFEIVEATVQASGNRLSVKDLWGLWKKSVSLLIRPQEHGRKFCRYET